MIDLKVDSVQWSPDETSLIVNFTEPAPATHSGATSRTLRCYVRVPVVGGETLVSTLKRASALLADTTVVMTPRKRPLN